MKLFKLYILIVLASLIFGVGNAYSHKLEDFKIDEVSYEEFNEEAKESESESVDEKDNLTPEKSAGQEEEKTPKQNTNTSSASSANQKKKQETKSSPVQNNHSQNSKTESGVVDTNGNNQPVEKNIVIDKTPWEKAGVSEYDWYHKPVHTWMRVDYNVSGCGSVSNCESQCMSDAEELSYTENVSCIQVYTYSGSYLGEMLKRD